MNLHGGGMVILTAADPDTTRWRNTLAAEGLVVVGVEFRNGGGKLGPHPFPAGLNDCAAGARWAHANRDALGITSITVSGESGGGNLCLATGLKARQEGWVDEIDGIYALCPYISGAYASPPSELPSPRRERHVHPELSADGPPDDRLRSRTHARRQPAGMGRSRRKRRIWRGCRRTSFPSTNSIRYAMKGLAFYRKLLAAGVSAVGRTVHGTTHGADIGMPDVIPEVHRETVRSIVGFARSL